MAEFPALTVELLSLPGTTALVEEVGQALLQLGKATRGAAKAFPIPFPFPDVVELEDPEKVDEEEQEKAQKDETKVLKCSDAIEDFDDVMDQFYASSLTAYVKGLLLTSGVRSPASDAIDILRKEFVARIRQDALTQDNPRHYESGPHRTRKTF